jgi:WD40 repeat protein
MVIGASGTGNALKLYDVASAVEVSGYQFADTTIASPRNTVAITGDLLVGGYENGTLEIWHLLTGKSWFTIANAHAQGIRELAVQKDGSVLSTSPDGVLTCWTMPKP